MTARCSAWAAARPAGPPRLELQEERARCARRRAARHRQATGAAGGADGAPSHRRAVDGCGEARDRDAAAILPERIRAARTPKPASTAATAFTSASESSPSVPSGSSAAMLAASSMPVAARTMHRDLVDQGIGGSCDAVADVRPWSHLRLSSDLGARDPRRAAGPCRSAPRAGRRSTTIRRGTLCSASSPLQCAISSASGTACGSTTAAVTSSSPRPSGHADDRRLAHGGMALERLGRPPPARP